MSESKISMNSSVLECPICFEMLNENSRMLPCQHTFHFKCLTTISFTNKELHCPICRMRILPSISQLPKNLFICSLVEQMKLEPSKSGDLFPVRTSEFVTLKRKLQSALVEMEELKDKLQIICPLQSEIEALKNKNAVHSALIESCKMENRNLFGKLKNSESGRKKQESDIYRLMTETQALKNENAVYYTQIKSYQMENKDLFGKLKQARSELKSSESGRKKQESDIYRLMTEIQALKNENAVYYTQIKSYQMENKDLFGKLKQARSELKSSESGRKKQESDIYRLMTETQTLKNENVVYYTQIKSYKAKNHNARLGKQS